MLIQHPRYAASTVLYPELRTRIEHERRDRTQPRNRLPLRSASSFFGVRFEKSLLEYGLEVLVGLL